VLGLPEKPKSVKLEGGDELVWEYTKGATATDRKDTTRMASLLTIKGKGLGIAQDWAIIIQ
jgi:alpha 1,3-glucosidase